MHGDTIAGLRLLGPARPIDRGALDEVERREGFRLPPSYRALLGAWGAGGRLCGFAYLLDPTDPTPRSSWRFYREFMPTDGAEFRREYGQWRAVDDETWARLVVWADLDGKTFAWDTGRPDPRGDYPVWYLDREGECAVLAGRSLDEIVGRFLGDGGLDRVHPPMKGGRWGLPATYATGRPADFTAPLLAALRAGDQAGAEAVLAAYADAVNGYETSAQLFGALLSRAADGVPAAARVEWLERAAAWYQRCAPALTQWQGVPAVLAALRAGGAIDDVVRFVTAVDTACAPLELAGAVARHDVSYLDVVVRNPGPAARAACVLQAEAEGDEGSGPFVYQLEVESLGPGAETTLRFGWPNFMPRRVRLALRPAP
ncbi:MAG TPA: SMI1/KNR4 family protein [Polyangiaceae bacterium]|nr:SMI1/KNR4 family protein [Polyangiaceae bacterium]